MTFTQPRRIGVIGVPGKWSTECLADALESLTGFRLVIDISRVSLDLANRALWYDDMNLCTLDGLAIKKISSVYGPETLERLDLLRVAEASGVRCFSPVRSVHGLVDRLSCTISLGNAGIRMPETTITERIDVAANAVRRYGSAVLKPLFSTKARGMVVLDNTLAPAELNQQLSEFHRRNPIMYIQKKHELSGEDYGVVFLGKRYLCTYSRVGAKDTWNTTINSGGKYRAHEPSAAILQLAQRARDVFDLDYTTVDVAITEEGPVVFEVSAFGGFRGVKEGAGLDAASLYADYMLDELGAST